MPTHPQRVPPGDIIYLHHEDLPVGPGPQGQNATGAQAPRDPMNAGTRMPDAQMPMTRARQRQVSRNAGILVDNAQAPMTRARQRQAAVDEASNTIILMPKVMVPMTYMRQKHAALFTDPAEELKQTPDNTLHGDRLPASDANDTSIATNPSGMRLTDLPVLTKIPRSRPGRTRRRGMTESERQRQRLPVSVQIEMERQDLIRGIEADVRQQRPVEAGDTIIQQQPARLPKTVLPRAPPRRSTVDQPVRVVLDPITRNEVKARRDRHRALHARREDARIQRSRSDFPSDMPLPRIRQRAKEQVPRMYPRDTGRDNVTYPQSVTSRAWEEETVHVSERTRASWHHYLEGIPTNKRHEGEFGRGQFRSHPR